MSNRSLGKKKRQPNRPPAPAAPPSDRAYAHAFGVAFVVFLIFAAALAGLARGVPGWERLTIVFANCVLASLLVGFLARGKRWAWWAMGLGVFLVAFVLFGVMLAWDNSDIAAKVEARQAWFVECHKLFRDAASVLERVRDPGTAKDATPQLEAITTQFEILAERRRSQPPLPKREEMRLQADNARELDGLTTRLANLLAISREQAGGDTAFVKAQDKLRSAIGKLKRD